MRSRSSQAQKVPFLLWVDDLKLTTIGQGWESEDLLVAVEVGSSVSQMELAE
jgi:hypothetical protein